MGAGDHQSQVLRLEEQALCPLMPVPSSLSILLLSEHYLPLASADGRTISTQVIKQDYLTHRMEHVKNADMKAKRITNIIMVGFPLAGRGQGVMSEQRLAHVKSVSH